MGEADRLDDAAHRRTVAIGSTGYRVLSPAPREIWHTITAESPQAMISQTPTWLDATCRAESVRDASRLYLAPDGRVLILPLVRRRVAGVANSMPAGYGIGGLIGREPERPDDVAACLADLGGLGLGKVSIRPNPLHADIWRSQADTTARVETRDTAIVDLSGGYEHFWTKLLNSSMRAKIRRATREGVEVEWDSSRRGVEIYYDLYIGWLDERAERRHLPKQLIRFTGRRRDPLAKFEAAADALGATMRTWIARFEGRPIAAAIELVHGKHAVYWRGASDRAAVSRTRANELVQCKMIEYACESGCAWYDMGESGGVESLMHFKRGFGAEICPTVEIHIESRAAAFTRTAVATVRGAVVDPVLRRLG